MQYKKLEEVKKLIDNKEIDSAENKLSQMQTEFIANEEYLFLRSKIFYMKKLYYLAIDTLLIALEHNEQDRTYKLLSKIYNDGCQYCNEGVKKGSWRMRRKVIQGLGPDVGRYKRKTRKP